MLEQNYRADPLSESLLLSLNEGKTIDFLVQRENKQEVVTGKIIRSGYTPHNYMAMNLSHSSPLDSVWRGRPAREVSKPKTAPTEAARPCPLRFWRDRAGFLIAKSRSARLTENVLQLSAEGFVEDGGHEGVELGGGFGLQSL